MALFKVDMLGLPEEPCLGECVPNGDLGLFEAVLCFGLLYTGECLGLGRADSEEPLCDEANKPPDEPLGEEEGEENFLATAVAAASLEPAGEF